MLNPKSDWLYCRLVDRGNFILPRSAFWFGHFELSSEPELDKQCLDALNASMRGYAVSESGDGWKRLVRARAVLLDDSLEEAMTNGSLELKETVRLLNAYIAQFYPVRETQAGYLFNLRARSAIALSPAPEPNPRSGAFAIIDDAPIIPNTR
jgi:hypothetical protein